MAHHHPKHPGNSVMVEGRLVNLFGMATALINREFPRLAPAGVEDALGDALEGAARALAQIERGEHSGYEATVFLWMRMRSSVKDGLRRRNFRRKQRHYKPGLSTSEMRYHAERLAVKIDRLPDVLHPGDPSADAELEQVERSDVLERLPDQIAKITHSKEMGQIVAWVLEGVEHQEIARRLGVSYATIYNRFRRLAMSPTVRALLEEACR
jgi:DNA-directed RNA polymerase specialized sigma24 family protein